MIQNYGVLRRGSYNDYQGDNVQQSTVQYRKQFDDSLTPCISLRANKFDQV